MQTIKIYASATTQPQNYSSIVEVYGSWKKVAPHLESSVFDSEVEKQLEEAMTDHDSHTVTVVTSGGNSTKTGFYPLGEG